MSFRGVVACAMVHLCGADKAVFSPGGATWGTLSSLSCHYGKPWMIMTGYQTKIDGDVHGIKTWEKCAQLCAEDEKCAYMEMHAGSGLCETASQEVWNRVAHSFESDGESNLAINMGNSELYGVQWQGCTGHDDGPLDGWFFLAAYSVRAAGIRLGSITSLPGTSLAVVGAVLASGIAGLRALRQRNRPHVDGTDESPILEEGDDQATLE